MFERLKFKEKLKIICTICYAGGVHEISQSPTLNVSTFSRTNYLMPSYANEDEPDFGKYFWELFDQSFRPKGDSTISLAELTSEAAKNSLVDYNLSRISSSDMVDKELNKGPYKVRTTESPKSR